MTGAGPGNGADPWKQANLREVLLPSGSRIRGVLPSVDILLLRGLIPTELRSVANSFAKSGGKVPAELGDDAPEWARFLLTLAAAFPRAVLDPATGEWTPRRYTADELEDVGEDAHWLTLLVTRRASAEQITAYSMLLLGQLTEEQAEEVREEAASDTVGAWAGFPGDGRGAGARDDGLDVGEPESEPAAPDRG